MKEQLDRTSGQDQLMLERVEEYQLSPQQHQLITDLLRGVFDVYPAGRSYYKQLPHFRLLAWEQDQLVGHLAAECRIINVGGEPVKVFGIADLCVAATHQQRRIATRLVAELEELGRQYAMEFLVLLTTEPAIYQALSFTARKANCCWLLISNFQTLGVMRRSVDNIMVKPLSGRAWPGGDIDFLGHIF